jgi:hypothetical protein
MHTLKIVRAPRGWEVQFGCAAVAPCKSQDAAVAQAERIAESIRRHGESVAIIIEVANTNDAETTARPKAAAAKMRRTPKRVHRLR